MKNLKVKINEKKNLTTLKIISNKILISLAVIFDHKTYVSVDLLPLYICFSLDSADYVNMKKKLICLFII